MGLASISITCKQNISFLSRTDFERKIYHSTYKEFQKKSKIYTQNQTLQTFSAMCAANPKANILQQKLNALALIVIEGLGHKMPVLDDNMGKALLFESAELEILESSLANKAGHVLAITYTSPKLILQERIGDLLILEYADKNNSWSSDIFTLKINSSHKINYQHTKELELAN